IPCTTNDLDVGEPGFIRRLRKPEHAGSNPAIQTQSGKGKPTGDGTPLETGRGYKPLRVQLPLLPLHQVPVAERPRRRSSKPARRSAATRSEAGSTPAGVSATYSGVAQMVRASA